MLSQLDAVRPLYQMRTEQDADGLRKEIADAVLIVKSVLLGNAGVGKRSLSHRLRYDEWGAAGFHSDLRIDFTVKRITSTGSTFPNDVKLQIWDSGMWGRFYKALPPSLTRGATIWYLCFEHRPTLDLFDEESITSHCQDALTQLEPWLHYLSTASALSPAPVLPFLLGLKSDVLPRPTAEGRARTGTTVMSDAVGLEAFNRQLCAMTTSELRSTIQIPELFHPLRCFHVSSKTNEGVDELLQYTADTIRAIFHRFPRGIRSTHSTYPSACRPGAVKLPLWEVPPPPLPDRCCFS